MNKRPGSIWVAAAMVVAAALAVTGCTSAGGGGGDSTSGNAAAPADRILNVGTTEGLSHTNPMLAVAGADSLYLQPMYDPLIRIDPKTLNLLPDAGLASKWGFVDGNLKLFRIELKKDIKFQDGTPLDAEAVKYSLQWSVEHGGNKQMAVVDEVEVAGTHELLFHLNVADATFPEILTGNPFWPLSTAALKKYGDKAGEHRAGTGPYVFSKWDHASKFTMTANKDYFGKKPGFNGITILKYSNGQSLVAALQTGKVQYANNIDPVDLPVLKKISSIRVEKENTVNLRLVQLSYAVEPLNDVRVRQAINYAIDRKAVVDTVYGADSGALPVTQPFSPHSTTFNADAEIKYDPAKAKSLLKEAGHADGVTVAACSYGAASPQEVEMYRSQLDKVGITLNVTTVPAIGSCLEGLTAHKFGVLFAPWGQPSAYQSVRSLITTFQYGKPDYSEIASRLDEVAATAAQEKRVALLQDLVPVWNEFVPDIFTFNLPNIVAYSNSVKGSAETLTREPDVSVLSY